MKKYSKIISVTLLMFFFTSSFAHSSGITSDLCLPWALKYRAFAEVNFMDGYKTECVQLQDGWQTVWDGSQYVTIPKYVTICNLVPNWQRKAHDVQRKCSRPVTADAIWYKDFGGATGWKVGHAGWQISFSGSYSTVQYSNHWQIKAGLFESMYINKDKFESMDKVGFTSTDVNAKISLENNILQINELSGEIAIQNNSNFYSTYQIVVFKEKTNLTQKESEVQEIANEKLNFENIVAQGGITIRNGSMVLDGFLKEKFATENYISTKDNTYGLDISNLNLSIPINLTQPLGADENLVFSVYADGGLDFTSVLADPNQNQKMEIQKFEESLGTITCYPNPSTDFLNIEFNNKSLTYNVKLYNTNGQLIETPFSDNSKGLTLSLENLPNGMYYVQIAKSDDSIETKKIIVKH